MFTGANFFESAYALTNLLGGCFYNEKDWFPMSFF